MARSRTTSSNKLLRQLMVAGIALVGAALASMHGCDQLFRPGNSLDHLPPIEVYFSPRGGVTDAVVRTLDSAQTSVFVQAYSFTSAPIAKALVDAHKRGVHVEVILDKSQRTEKYSSLDFLYHAGIPTWVDARHGIAHNKVMILDGKVVITGSFNFTKSAEESNAENLLIIRDKVLARLYLANWQTHREHSQQYLGKPGDAQP